jgi:thiol-disulfide isomerase/thioredoxin
MPDVVDRSPRPNRLWLLPVVLLLAGAGIWYSAQRRAALRTEVVSVGGGKPQLFDFGMGLCEQCKRMKPVMERAARELGACVDVQVLDIRNEANEQLAERYKMRAIPFILLVDGAGKELWRKEGFVGFPDLSAAVAKSLGWPVGQACAGGAR